MTDPTSQTLPFKFTGTGSEYFKIWIVNIILTILTLGIYSAWAKVRSNRYFYGNTKLNDSAFEYHATPMMILRGRLIAFGVLMIYVSITQFFPTTGGIFIIILILLAPWIIWRSLQFNSRMVSYRNIRFGFYGSLKETYIILLLIPFLPIIIGAIIAGIVYFLLGTESTMVIIFGVSIMAMGLIFPYVQKLMASYGINNRQFGQGKFSVELAASRYYMIYLILGLLNIAFFVIIILAITLILWLTGEAEKIMMIMSHGGAEDDVGMLLFKVVMMFYFILVILGFWSKAFLQANIKNYVFNNTKLDDTLQFNSNIKVGKLLGIYILNILLIVFSLGLAYPWAIINLKKYKIESTSATGDIAQYVNQQQQAQSAVGEELGEVFDTDLDLGI